MCLKWLISLSLLLVVLGFATVSSQRWIRRSAILDEERRFHLKWETGKEDDIVFEVEVRTLGYVALGFSKDGTMKDNDFVVGWVSKGNVYLQDRYAEGNQMPELDRKQDYELISGSENDTHTVLKFRRKLDTCDCQDFALEYDNTIRVMYSYSYEDPKDEINIPSRGTFSSGYKSLMLLQPELERETDVQYMDLTVNDFAVSPEWDTMYWCKLFKAPEKKYHVTTFEMQILDGSQGYVHHLVWSECAGALPGEYDQYVGAEGFACFDPNSPSFVRSCDGELFGWGIGGEDVVLPDHFGIPVGPRHHYYMLQVHYDNANRDTGRPGTAGIKLHVTPHLRQYDGGVFMIGSNLGVSFVIPPGMKDFIVAGHSNPDCLGPIIPEEGVMIHSACLHTHYTGKRVKLRHYRDTKELEPIADNKHYDPLYQQCQILEEERLLLPWDKITVECTYDTSNRTRTTFGGYSTREEMCLTFMMYYPKVEGVYGSLSRVQKRTMNKYIGSQDLISLTAGELNHNQTFVDYMEEYDWNRTAIRRFENKVRFSEQDTNCYIGTGDLRTVETTTSYPEKLQEYFKPRSCSKHSEEKDNMAQSVKLNKSPHKAVDVGDSHHQEMEIEGGHGQTFKVGDGHTRLNLADSYGKVYVKDDHRQGLKSDDGYQGLNDGKGHQEMEDDEFIHHGLNEGKSHRQGLKSDDGYQGLNVGKGHQEMEDDEFILHGLNEGKGHRQGLKLGGSHQGLKARDSHYRKLHGKDSHHKGFKVGDAYPKAIIDSSSRWI